MSKRFPLNKNDETKKVIDYAECLNEKSILQNDNGLLKLTIESQSAQLIQLNQELKSYGTAIKLKDKRLEELSDELQQSEEQRREEQDLRQSLLETHNEFQTKIAHNMKIMKSNYNDQVNEIQELKCELDATRTKSKKYKDRLKFTLNVLHNYTHSMDKKKMVNGESQTHTNLSMGSSQTQNISDDNFDERILSELFYKGNPFLDSL